jgi:predicted phosphodiesterase
MPKTPPTPPVYTRIGIVGDIHTEADALEWALDELHAQKVERILATGDIADGPHQGAGVIRACKLLRAANVLAVLGNHDRWMLDGEHRDLPGATFVDELDAETKAYLQGLPVCADIMTPLGLMSFGHGLARDDMAGLYPSDHGPALTNNSALQGVLHAGHYQLVVSGHTHRRMVRKVEGVLFINAGAIQITREPCCLVLDFVQRRARFLDLAADGGTIPGPEFPL